MSEGVSAAMKSYNVFMPRRSSSEVESLLIDRAAAAELPSADAVREWAAEKRAFISSIMAEFPAERQAVAAGIRAVGLRPVMFEEFGGRDADPEEAYLAEVEGSDIYIGILGKRYGKPLKSRFSPTHAEYRHAEQHALRMAVWTLDTNEREGPEQSFLDEVRTFYVAPKFSSVDDLRRQVEDRLKAIAAEDLAPWCKLGNVVFRATEIEDRGNVIQVKARVRGDAVALALEDMRGDKFNRGTVARITWSGRSKYAKVTGVHVTTTSGKSKMVRLELAVTDSPQDHFREISVNGKSPADLTELGLRSVLFGEPNPFTEQHMGFATEIPDPLAPLRENPVSEEIVRPLAELLITDLLVGTERAKRIVTFRLGVAIQGRRKLALAWEPPSRYSNQTERIREISGDVKL
jgi:hypothetical protein